jgi:acetate kinase
MKILVVNAGSSTVKFGLVDARSEETLFDGAIDWSVNPARFEVHAGAAPAVSSSVPLSGPGEAVKHLLEQMTSGPTPLLSHPAEVGAVGHRVVHGGDRYRSSVRVTPEVKAGIAALAELAPLHNPINLEGIIATETAWPGTPQVAVFDTAFHATLPDAARIFALPYAWTRDWSLYRFGFHGLSHAYCSSRAAQMLGRQAGDGFRVVVCHLGQGCSVSAVRDGRCVETSMSFTPLDGLVMGTRSGSVDPGLLIHVLRHKGLTVEDLDRVLNRESGLLGVSGLSGDMRQVQAAAAAGNAQARLALDVFTHRLRQTIGAMAVTLGGLDALVFTAGIGERSAQVRAATCAGLECLGLHLDAQANANGKPDADIATLASPGRILVIGTREDLTVVRETVRVLS